MMPVFGAMNSMKAEKYFVNSGVASPVQKSKGMKMDSRFLPFKGISIVFSAVVMSACSSVPPMQDPGTYSKMNCDQIKTERAAIEENRNYHQDNSSFGFFDILGSLAEGIAMGSGKSADASQLHASNAQREQSRQDSKAAAEAYDNRVSLLNKISVVRKCN